MNFLAWRSRIPFAKIMLKSVLQVIQQYPSTVLVGVIGMVCAYYLF